MRRNGFTSVELAVAVAVIALVATVSVPALTRARAQAQEAGCVRALTQTGIGWDLYTLDNAGSRGLAGTNWCLPIMADGSLVNGVSDNPYYPSASAPWSLAVAGLGYIPRQTMACPAGDGGGGIYCDYWPVQAPNWKNTVWAGWLNHYFGTTYQATPDRPDFGGQPGQWWWDFAAFMPCDYASNLYLGWTSHPLNGVCFARGNDAFCARHNEPARFVLAMDAGRRQDKGPDSYGGQGNSVGLWWENPALVGQLSGRKPNMIGRNKWQHGARHEGGAHVWLFLDGHVARVMPYPDGLEAVYVECDPAGKITKGLTWEQLGPHYVEAQGLQFLPNGYTTQPRYRVNESMERGTDDEYRDIFVGPWPSACTKYVCGGMRWDPHLNAVPAYPNE